MRKISVITVVRNGASTIRDCIGSVRSQALDVEQVVVDGCSADNTLDIVRRLSPDVRVLSESDNGIYEAINKGIAMTSGNIIGILNADDIYVDGNVLKKVAAVFEDESIDSCYGDLVYVDAADNGKVRRYWRSGPYSARSFYWGWMPPHPTFFVRRSIYEKYGLFSLDLGSAADYELMLRFLVKHRITTAYIPEVLVLMRTGGVSNASLINRLKANWMDRKAWVANRLKPLPWTLLLKPVRKIPQFFYAPSPRRKIIDYLYTPFR